MLTVPTLSRENELAIVTEITFSFTEISNKLGKVPPVLLLNTPPDETNIIFIFSKYTSSAVKDIFAGTVIVLFVDVTLPNFVGLPNFFLTESAPTIYSAYSPSNSGWKDTPLKSLLSLNNISQ